MKCFKAALELVQSFIISQTLNGDNRFSISLYSKHHGTFDGFTIQQHRTSTGLPEIERIFGTCQSKIFSQKIDKKPVGFNISLNRFVVDRASDVHRSKKQKDSFADIEIVDAAKLVNTL